MMRVFNETQKVTQWWLQLINIAILGFLVYTSYKWFVLNEAVGNVSTKNLTGQIVVIAMLIFSVGLIYMCQLKTTIDEIGLHYQFLPIKLSKKTIRWTELKKCYVRIYNPVKEYGGWGYRLSFNKGKALNVKGNKGIQLEFKDGRKLLIGTQKQEDAQNVIERYFKTNDG